MMGGRGRGRGGKPMSLNVEALGFGRGGESLPTGLFQPPPLYPELQQQPLPINQSDMYSYLLELKRDMRIFMEDSPYHLKLPDSKRDIERYSDRYKNPSHTQADKDVLLMNRMPEELQPQKSKRSAGSGKSSKGLSAMNAINVLEKREGQGEQEQSEEENDSKEGDTDAEDVDGDEDEDEMEEDNDYIQEYFDNGENFVDADDDALDDGPVY